MSEEARSVEVLSYIVDNHDEQIKALRQHAHETNKSFIILEENIRIINANLEKILEDSVRLSTKINVLDEDLRDRLNKSKLIQKLASLWPLLLVAIFIMSAIDHSKVSALLKTVSS